MTPAELCGEFGVSQGELWKVMREMRFNITRMAALLNSTQERQLRQYWENQAKLKARPIKRTTPLPRRAMPPARPVAVAARSETEMFFKTCTCCDRRWALNAIEDRPEPLCPECKSHFPKQGESPERRLDRAESHAVLCRKDRDNAYQRVQEMSRERDQAYESRAKWRNALVEVVLDHDEGPGGVCWCGDKYPCRTWKALFEANRGIHTQVEKWASWSDQRLEDYLYGDEHRRTSKWVIEEDLPPTSEAADLRSPGDVA